MSGDWADIAVSNSRLLTQAIAKLAAAERERDAAMGVVQAARAWREVICDTWEDERSWLADDLRLAEAIDDFEERDAAGRGEP